MPEFYTEVPPWNDEDPVGVESNEINPDTLESTMTFKNSKDKIVRSVRYRKNGTREVQDYDPKTGKPKGAPVIHLPDRSPQALEIKEAAEQALQDLENKMKDAA